MAKQTTLSGAFLPSAKRRPTCTHTADPDHNPATFKEEWKEAAPWPKANSRIEGQPATWLQLVTTPVSGMMCLLCTKYQKEPRSGKPIWSREPCTLFRLQSVRRHASCHMHCDAVRQEIDHQLSVQDGGIAQAFEHSWEVEERSVRAAMSCVYWLAKEEIPHMTKYKPLLELIQHLGLPFIDTLNKGASSTYTSHMMINEFLSITSDQVRCCVLEKIRNSPCFGIICDETTDIATTSQLIVYVKAIVDEEVNTFFIELSDGTADTITQCLQDCLIANGLSLSNCVGLGSDGATVMTGVHSGVSTQLKHLQPTIISVHCVAHRLALAVLQASRQISVVERFKKQINALFVYFHGSPKRQGRLNAAFSALEDKPGLKLQRPSDTRWLACNKAIQVVKKSLIPLSAALSELANDGDITALGLATVLRKYQFIAGVFFMAEVMPVLTRLSKTFQIENIDCSSIKPALDRAISSITSLKSQSTIKQADWQGELKKFVEDSTEALSSQDEGEFLTSFVLPFLTAVERNLLDRFPPHDVTILSAAAVFDPLKVPTQQSNRYHYGRDSITRLANHYKCDLAATLSEWKEVISVGSSEFQTTRDHLLFLVSRSAIYPNLAKICCSLLVIPIHSADCERGLEG